ncbi:glycosyltransferase family 4 protein [Pseudothioglobus sp. nBUS_23]|uniref:glycosyltransferase family 4 protein n=1 Tax=Pseudothioglobus sp. nBUS_23 TaxID=3395318 RepID=UPI003EBA3FB9
MKIIYDSYIFTEQKYGGISRYFSELLKKFNNNDIQASAPLLFSNNQYISDGQFVKHYQFLPNKTIKGKQRLLFLINRIAFLFFLKVKDFDIIHPTYYDVYYLKLVENKKLILTVYDMIHEKFYDDEVSRRKQILCERADLIIAISQNTKKDLIEIFNIQESKIRVVYLASSLNKNSVMKSLPSLPQKYLLFVGHRGLYKNFERFVVAISKILNENVDLFVICAGGNNFEDSEISLFKKFSLEERFIQFNIDDDTISSLYKNALLFVFPSLYEGFGIPLLEAFSCGCPVACSDASSFPEIALDGAVYFDPENVDSMYHCISQILFDQAAKQKLVSNAYKRLNSFSWEITASETKKIYNEVLS